jgi:hypothetical protein
MMYNFHNIDQPYLNLTTALKSAITDSLSESKRLRRNRKQLRRMQNVEVLRVQTTSQKCVAIIIIGSA